jgi:hypothetical protein
MYVLPFCCCVTLRNCRTAASPGNDEATVNDDVVGKGVVVITSPDDVDWSDVVILVDGDVIGLDTFSSCGVDVVIVSADHVTLAEGDPDWLVGKWHVQLTSLPSGTEAGQVLLSREMFLGFPGRVHAKQNH